MLSQGRHGRVSRGCLGPGSARQHAGIPEAVARELDGCRSQPPLRRPYGAGVRTPWGVGPPGHRELVPHAMEGSVPGCYITRICSCRERKRGAAAQSMLTVGSRGCTARSRS